MQINPYLAFDGQCKHAFQFYAKCLHGEIVFMMTNGESPMASQMPPEQHDRVMHASLKVGEEMLAGADAPPEHYRKPQGFCVSLDIKDPAEAERVFGALSENGTVQMPLQETFWALRFGMFIDQFSIPWMVNCGKPM
ncbi:MAG TPA: VOC family protein [Candidatus Acidoferrum sp.]|nr:VOC family protein [Candidatus Acidoferrum sp.]